MKTYSMLFIAVLLSALVCGCIGGDNGETKNHNIPETTDVLLSASAMLDGENITLDGTATVPDGTILVFQICLKDSYEYILEEYMVVEDQKYSINLTTDKPDVLKNNYEIWIAFQTTLGNDKDQPSYVLDYYGEMGENITGPYMVESGYIKRAEIVIDIS